MEIQDQKLNTINSQDAPYLKRAIYKIISKSNEPHYNMFAPVTNRGDAANTSIVYLTWSLAMGEKEVNIVT